MRELLKALKSDWSKRILFRYTSMYLIAVIIVLALLGLIRSEMYKMNYSAIVEEGNKKIDAGLSLFSSTVNMMCTSADIMTELDEYGKLRKWTGVGKAEFTEKPDFHARGICEKRVCCIQPERAFCFKLCFGLVLSGYVSEALFIPRNQRG